MLPEFVIIGAQKSASSFMQACLADHPDIYLPPGETPYFESPFYERGDIGRHLAALFTGRTERCVGIKRPNSIGMPEVPARIAQHLPDAKLIAVLRNPVDRAISAYFHNIKYGFLPPLDVEVGMRRLLDDPTFAEAHPRAPEILEFGYYNKYLTLYGHYLERSQLLVFLHEDIVREPLESIQRAYAFLGVAPDFVPASLGSRPQEVVYHLTRLRVLTRRNRFMYDYNDDRTRLQARRMTRTDKAMAGMITGFDRHVLARVFRDNKPHVGATLRGRLFDLYEHDIDALATLVGRDLSAWRPPAAQPGSDPDLGTDAP